MTIQATIRLEVCVGDPDSLAAAIEGGAERVELCSALELGGLTPTPGLIRQAAGATVPVYAMIRPRGGDFVFGAREVEAMLADIAAVRDAGLAGVALGASRPDGRLDEAVLRRLLAAARGLGATLHRAVDLAPDLGDAVELAAALGFERILTSGGARTAPEGVAGLRVAHERARGRLSVMAGSGVTAANVGALLDAVPLSEVHASCSRAGAAPSPRAVAFGFAAASPARRTRAQDVRALRHALSARTS